MGGAPLTLAGHDDGNMPVCAKARCPQRGEGCGVKINRRRAPWRPGPNFPPAGVAAEDVMTNLRGRWQEGRIIRLVDSMPGASGHVVEEEVALHGDDLRPPVECRQ